MKRLHIVGCPRSGTTLLLELLATCFEFDRRSRFDFSIFKAFDATSGLLLSKQPTDILHLRALLPHDPTLHAICIVRDPRAVIASKDTTTESYFSNYRIWKACDNAARKLQSHPRVLQIRYEDLVCHPDKVQQTIMRKFRFLVFKHFFSRFEKYAKPDAPALQALNGLRAVEAGGIFKWQQHLARIKSQLLLSPALQRDLEYHGYEENADWQQMLAHVTPQQFSCRYDDSVSIMKEFEQRLRLWFQIRQYIKRAQALKLEQHLSDWSESFYRPVLNKEPIPVVAAIATAPHSVTRRQPLSRPAPPA